MERPDLAGIPSIASPRGRATLKDIARSVGVDVSTVSKVLNGGEISVREQTREAITAEAARVNYRPHAMARNLRTQRTGALGILLPDLTNPVYATIVRGAVRRAEENGYVMLVAEVGNERAAAEVYLRLVGERRIDGLIIAVTAESSEMLAAIASTPLPHVFVNRRAPVGCSVSIDDHATGYLAARTLIEAGHRQLGFIGAGNDLDTARRRRAGFNSACEQAGIPAVIDAVGPYSRRGGYEACLRLLKKKRRPTGIFASNLLVGIGALAALRERNVGVPQEVSVISLDAEDAIYTAPPLTAIATPLDEMGARAVEELNRMIGGHEPKGVVIDTPPRLVLRESLGPPPA